MTVYMGGFLEYDDIYGENFLNMMIYMGKWMAEHGKEEKIKKFKYFFKIGIFLARGLLY